MITMSNPTSADMITILFNMEGFMHDTDLVYVIWVKFVNRI